MGTQPRKTDEEASLRETLDALTRAGTDDDARCQLAGKIARLVPGLDPVRHADLSEYVVKVLELLAKDQVTRVRLTLAEELKSMPEAPPQVVATLAWDTDARVAAPILEFSPLLSDDMLLEIVAASEIPGVLEAIARRATISAGVSDAIAHKGDVGAVAALLANSGAAFTEETLEYLIVDAPEHDMWHVPLMLRPELTQRTMNRIAEFVSASVLEQLDAEHGLPDALHQNLSQAVRARLKSLEVERQRKAEAEVERLHRQGALDGERISEALLAGEREFVIEALRVLAGVPREAVERIMAARHPGAVTSLVWRAGLSMRVATQLQLRLARIHHARVLNARGGVDFPLTPEQMREYLRFFVEDT